MSPSAIQAKNVKKSVSVDRHVFDDVMAELHSAGKLRARGIKNFSAAVEYGLRLALAQRR